MNLYRLLFGQKMEGAGDGTGTGGSGDSTGTGTGGGAGSGQDGGADWRASLPEDIRGDKSLTDIKDVGALAKGYIEGQKLIGRSIRIPGKDAGKADLDAFHGKLTQVQGVFRMPDGEDEAAMGDLFTKLGRPDSADKYQLKRPEKMPDGITYNEATEKVFREAAFKLGLSQKQLDGMFQVYFQDALQKAEGHATEMKKGVQALRGDWGVGYDQRMAAASAFLKQFGGQELADELTPGALAAWPGLAKALSKAGMMFMEDGTIRGDSATLTPSVSELKSKISEIQNNKDHPYHDRSKPGHQEAVQRVNSYYEQIANIEKSARS